MEKRILIPVIVIFAALWGLWVHWQPHRFEPIYAGPSVVETTWLSTYNPELANTPGDTRIFVLEGNNPGGTAVILGGTHANEAAGILSAVLIVESVELEQGRLIVIPNTNASAASYYRPLRGEPWRVQVPVANGENRYFRYGSRHTHPLHQWPDSYSFNHPLASQPVSGMERRNLNRVHPGKGKSLTENISQAIVNLLITEEADLVFDLHEASPQSRLANNIVVHPRALELGAEVTLNLQFSDLDFHLEASSEEFRGLSHRELGDATPALAILTETANPYQGGYFIDSSYQTILSGEESGYRSRLEQVRFPHAIFQDLNMAHRVGRHLAVIQESLLTYSMYNPEDAFSTTIPSYSQITESGLSPFFADRKGGNSL